MKAKYNGEKWVVDVTGQQFQEMVEGFFKRNPIPACDELKDALVPVGISNAVKKGEEGKFGPNGIFKYKFVSSDGIDLMVKYHGVDEDAGRNNPGCNSSIGWTAQIVCNYCSYFTWDAKKKKAGTVTVASWKVERGKAPRENFAHIPLRGTPFLGTED